MSAAEQAAGSAFNILFKGGAGSAVDSVIPALLAGLEGESHQASQALEGLRVILGVRPQTLGSMVRTHIGGIGFHLLPSVQDQSV